MQREARSRRMEALRAHPVAELLECPPAIGLLLNVSARFISFDAGEVVFRQSANCQGLYLVVTGQFLRRSERLETRLTLAPARPGELVELAAALGDGRHTYTLAAQTAGSVLMLPIEDAQPGLSELSTPADAFVGGTGSRGFPRLYHLLLRPRGEATAGKLCGLTGPGVKFHL